MLAAGASPNTRDTYASESLPLSVRAALTNPTLFDALMDAGADPAPLLAFGTEGTALTFEVTEPQVLRRLLGEPTLPVWARPPYLPTRARSA